MNGLANTPSVAIIGRPNVGKSALFNRLIGRKIAIVHDHPGITRDRISAICTRGTRPFVLWDTGGIFGAGEAELSAQVRGAAEQALRESDLLLLVVDAKEGLSPIDEELARALRKSQKPVVLVINKIDEEKHEPLAAEFDSLGLKSSNAVSAEHGRGISDLLGAIDRLLPLPAVESGVRSHESLAVAVLGRPNVGKSSLINSILCSERAIVSELPGTTRDAIDILYERNGRRLVFIDTAGIRRRGKQSTSVEIFSVMRAERSIRRADLCVVIVDLTAGVTAQDKRIAGLIQAAQKPAIIILNKWDLVKPKRNQKQAMVKLMEAVHQGIFFLEYAPLLITSSLTGEHVSKLVGLIEKIQRAARQRIGTGVLNRLLRQAFEANPPATIKARRLKLFYAAQSKGKEDQQLEPPKFVLFVNDPRLLSQTYKRYLESRIRDAQPFPGLPIILTLRPRAKSETPESRLRAK
ncbi:MAG TPA: ribosome biogenesis GTPase Der [Candidatus Udaeobacter sp.]|nr:ribosome biogenesis GTPase Der [Candidatus Udaeobacter sp.]